MPLPQQISSSYFNKLSKKDFASVVEENINKIDQCRIEHERVQIRNLYQNANDNDNEALKIQMQLRDKINSLTGDY